MFSPAVGVAPRAFPPTGSCTITITGPLLEMIR